MLGHLQLQIAILEMSDDVEEQTRPAQFGVAIETEEDYLLLGRRHPGRFRSPIYTTHYGFVGQVHHPLYLEFQEIDLRSADQAVPF